MLLRLRIINTFLLSLEMQVNMTHWKKIAIKRFQLVCQNRKSLAEGEDKNWHSYFGSKEGYAWQSWEQWDIDPNFSTGLLLDSPQAFLVQQVTWTERQWERDPRGNKVGLKYSVKYKEFAAVVTVAHWHAVTSAACLLLLLEKSCTVGRDLVFIGGK